MKGKKNSLIKSQRHKKPKPIFSNINYFLSLSTKHQRASYVWAIDVLKYTTRCKKRNEKKINPEKNRWTKEKKNPENEGLNGLNY